MSDMRHIRNFSIIAHIDHGKSTLADRMLELTGTIEPRKMRAQVLDSMELERERGITIKMQPVRMTYTLHPIPYTLNLIDTPGHIDFSYEVSRSLRAVEGAILLVDSTQGIQAQTLTTLDMAREAGLTIIPAVSKIDSPLARVSDVKREVAEVLAVSVDLVLECSGKTGEGVKELLEAVLERVPQPKSDFEGRGFRALVFDFQYSLHRGLILYLRVMDGVAAKGKKLTLHAVGRTFQALEVGYLSPDEHVKDSLGAGEIGYLVTGIKDARFATVGDTVADAEHTLPALAGYEPPRPVVWASLYPKSQDDYDLLRQSLERLHLTDSSLSFEEEVSGVMGRGFRAGFLGMLHLEIVTERLRREFSLDLIATTPSTSYEIETKKGKHLVVYSPALFPDEHEVTRVREPWIVGRIITPSEYVGEIMRVFREHEVVVVHTSTLTGERVMLDIEMPLRELMRGFFHRLKSLSSGYASLSYKVSGMRDADVVRIDILVADEPVPALARVAPRSRVPTESERAVEKLTEMLPKQLFVMKIQAKAMGRIVSSRTVSAMRKDVTGYLYGGDVTRKMKLLEKQKKGKKKMLARGRGRVQISNEVFLKMLSPDE